ncbi:hypothetical protein [Spirosoma sp. KUDC1026]|uniref:hypothetical protein n=1 Tax=Spirosoma sp. KUDC1026 TaxID=2745947 RepID=UPI00159BC588|nr:hypothetical protein [Spirosoma sp. KUDC1026]QKZ12165.1 hypothetical protein HU175_05795 [Spirosoma sp. KUDC1026]
MNVLLFRTDINTSQRAHRAACRLCTLRNVCRWSLDLEDKDCLLRIDSGANAQQEIDPQAIIRVLTKAGLSCQLISIQPN